MLLSSLWSIVGSGASESSGEPWWVFATIPVIAGVIGWGTNWLAIRMTFWPIEFVGIKPVFGWQGIIPIQARKMASIAMDNSMARIGSLSDVVEEMQPDELAKHVLDSLAPKVPELIEELARREYPAMWERAPEPVRQAIIDRCASLLPGAVEALKDDIAANIDQLIDMRMMVIDQLSTHKELLNRIFLEAGEKEFRFLVNSGLYFGFGLGLIQMAVQIWLDAFWVLPVFGVAVGYATNWLALKMIFEPAEPKKVGPFTFQAQFVKRKDEVSAYFAAITTKEILTIRAFVDRMLNGPAKDRTAELVRSHMRPLVDDAIGIAKPVLQLAGAGERIEALPGELAQQAIGMTMEPFDDPAFSASRAVLVEKLMYERMSAMTDDEFAQLLKPVVEADAWKLIAVGAALGGLAGLAQAALVFA